MKDAGSDIELVRLIRKGDERAARELWARVGPSLLAVATAVLRDRARAEDVVQDAMCLLLELPRREVAGIAEPRAYLACVVRRLALNEARGEARARKRARDSHSEAGRDAAPDGHELERVRDALASLPDEMAEVVVLRHAAGLTFDQLAAALGENRSTVAGRYRRGVEMLEELLGEVAERGAAVQRVNP